MTEGVWCLLCGKRFGPEEVKGASCCPACKCEGVPCSYDQDFKIEVNWHELHLLIVWAENWARHIGGENMDTVHAIARRMQSQTKDSSLVPLSLSGEISGIPAQLSDLGVEVSNIETNINKPPLIVVNGPGAVGFSKDIGD